MPAAAMTPFTACSAYSYFAGQALLMTSQKVGHAQNIYYQRIVL